MKHLYEERVVKIPAGCKVTLKDKIFTFKGELGTQSYDASKHLFTFELDNSVIRIRSWHGNKHKHDMLGTVSSHIRNNAVGVVKGYKFTLRAAYKHFSINMAIADNGKTVVVRNFLGTKSILSFPMRGESKAMIGETKDILVIQGINLEDVSQSAAHVQNTVAKRKKHDVRTFLDGIFVSERTSIVQ